MKRQTQLECLAIAGTLTILGILLFPILTGRTTLAHDNLWWDYPLFHFTAESLLNGILPLWNPFTHGGEPFYPILGHIRLFDPLTLVDIYVGQLFTRDTLLLFNWDRVIQSLVTLFGVYLVFRPFARHLLTRVALILVLTLSSTLLGSFRQDAILNQFVWVPYLTLFFLKIFYQGDFRWRNWLWLALFAGLKWQSYFFTGTTLFALAFLGPLLVVVRRRWQGKCSIKGMAARVGVFTLIQILMLAPDVVLFMQRKDFVYPARVGAVVSDAGRIGGGASRYEGSNLKVNPEVGLIMPYDLIRVTGSFASPWDYLQTLAPGNLNINPPFAYHLNWGNPSEAYLYFGMLAIAVIWIGLIFGQHPLKKIWLWALLFFGLLNLGPTGGLHRLLYPVLPALWLTRHTHALVLFLSFALLFFFVLGVESLFEPSVKSELDPRRIRKTRLFFSTILLTAFGFWVLRLVPPYHDHAYAVGLAAVGVFWLLRSYFSRLELVGSLLASQAFLIILFHPKPINFVVMSFWALAVPVSLYFANESGFSRRYCQLAFVSTLAFDLIFSFTQASLLYEFHPHPKEFLSVDTLIEPPVSLAPKALYETTFEGPLFLQAVRYLSLLQRKSTMLSPLSLRQSPRDDEEAVKAKRWVTFLSLPGYSALTHADLGPKTLKQLFSVGIDPIQFRERGEVLSQGGFIDKLTEWGDEKGKGELEHSLFLQAPLPLSPSADPSGPGRFSYNVEAYRYSELKLSVSIPRSGYLEWVDGYHPDWEAKVDGTRIPIVRANGNFKAVALPAGTHEIEFDFRPTEFLFALAAFYLAVFGAFSLAIFSMVSEIRWSQKWFAYLVSKKSRPIKITSVES